MATKAKDTNSVVGKEKKAQSSNSSITSTKKSTTTKASTTTSSTNKPTLSPSEKQVPNYLKPTISSVRLESHSSFKLPRNETPTKPNLNRRRSFDPSSHSRLPKHTHPSLSRTHKALVSPGPRDRTFTHRSSSVPIKTTHISNTSKPTPERLSKTPKEGRTQAFSVKNAKKSSSNVSTSTNKKVITNYASANSTNASKSCDSATAETPEAIGVEIEPEVKETINEDVGEAEKVENQEELSHQVVDSEHEHEHDHDHDQKLEESEQPHVEAENEKVIPTVLEQKEEKIEDDNTNQDEGNNNESHPEIDHSTIEEEVEVKEKEQEQEKEKEKEEGGIAIEKDHKIEDKNEEEVVELKKEGVEEGTSEEVRELKEKEGGEDEHVQSEVKEEKKVEPSEASGVVQEKTESSSQISHDVNEESGNKLVDARKRGVRALAGAFQNVIDHQT